MAQINEFKIQINTSYTKINELNGIIATLRGQIAQFESQIKGLNLTLDEKIRIIGGLNAEIE